MTYRRSLAMIGVTFLVLASTAATPRASGRGAGVSCPVLVRSALDTTGELCDGTGRNEACYGNILVEAEPRADVANFRFAERGDIVDVADMQSVRTSPLDLIKGEWGVALLRLQALLTDDNPAHNLTLVLMGNATLEPIAASYASAPAPTVPVTGNNPRIRTNIRELPTTASAVVGKLEPGTSVLATGRLADGSWLRVALPEGGEGWMYAKLVSSEGSFADLPVVQTTAPAAGPMHAFYFRSGLDDAACPEAPESGLLVQTPEGVAEVTLLINEVDIQLGSTVFFQAQAGDGLYVYVVEGHADVTAFGMTEQVPAGAFSVVPLDADGMASGSPADAEPYDLASVMALPLSLLERAIEIAPPADDGDDVAGEPEGEFEEDTDGGKPDTMDKERPGQPNPPANPNPPGDPEPPGNPPPLDDDPGVNPGKGHDKDKGALLLVFIV